MKNESMSNERAKRILTDNLHMTLATSQENKPWSTPVFYAHDDQYNFYWYSRKDTRHSLTIQENNNVSASIYGTGNDDEGFGVYIEGVASEVIEKDLEHALKTYAIKAAKTNEEKQQLTKAEDFLNDSPLRMYKLVPENLYISNEATKWNGKWIDTKNKITLTEE